MAGALSGRVALVTGGGRGIGRTIALALAGAGADVVVVARTEAEVGAVAEEIRGRGARAAAIAADLAFADAARGVVDDCVRALAPPEILVNAAAVQGPIGRFDTTDLREWIRTVQTDLIGPAAMAHAVIPHMLKLRRGKIVNVSGGGAASPRPGFSAYATSKAGLIRLTETLAEELREQNIQVNAMAPGATRTRMTEEVLNAPDSSGDAEVRAARETWASGGTAPALQAALTVFLAGPESDHVTGRFFHVNDPWTDARDGRDLPADLYTLRRVNPVPVSSR